jgi:hypothetical protein
MSTSITTRILHRSTSANTSGETRPWVWPLPRLDGLEPSIIEFGREQPPLDGVALGYQGRSSSPGLVPVFAAQDGIVTYAGNTADGSTVCLDHVGGWSTQYAHLLTRPTDRFRRRRKERVRAGDVIGHASRSALRIRFALSQLTDDGCLAVQPAHRMPAWTMLPWFSLAVPLHSPRHLAG